MEKFESGAKSSVLKPLYHLIPIEALTYIAERFALGALTHGEHNYQKGLYDDAFVKDRKNHMVEHLFNYINGLTVTDKDGRMDTPLDHLKAVLCNGSMLAWVEETRRKDAEESARIVIAESLPWETKS